MQRSTMIQQGRQNRKICPQHVCRLTKPAGVTGPGTQGSKLLTGTVMSGFGVYGQRAEAENDENTTTRLSDQDND